VTDPLLAAVNARLSRQRMIETEDEEMAVEAAAAGGVSVVSGVGILHSVAGAERSLLGLLLAQRADCDEPGDGSKTRSTAGGTGGAAPRAVGIGSLVRPEDIYLRPEVLAAPRSRCAHGLDLDQLGAVDVLEEDARWARSSCRHGPHCAFTINSRAH